MALKTWLPTLFLCIGFLSTQTVAFRCFAAAAAQTIRADTLQSQLSATTPSSNSDDAGNDNTGYAPTGGNFDRRSFIHFAPIVGAALFPTGARAEPNALPSNPLGYSPVELESGLLESRVTENLMSPPPYGLEGTDIFYPEWFAGVWDVYSVTTDVQAPCGQQLFGGNATFAAAKKEIGPGNALTYRSRFISGANGIIADREFNVREIAKAAMGENSVVGVNFVTPNKFSCLLSPAGAQTMLSVDLITLSRRQETIDDKNFHCSEVVRQIVAPADKSKPQGTLGPPQQGSKTTLLKEIETASLYTIVDGDKIKCQQRSATFLLPSQQDPIAYQLWQMSRGRPIDVRFYDVTYTKR